MEANQCLEDEEGKGDEEVMSAGSGEEKGEGGRRRARVGCHVPCM